MAKNTFVQSIKTIAESLIQKAGFDKTRSGKIVGVNTLTNTYSVRIDGYTYNNVRVVDDSTYNVGDTVKVNIPCNQPSQMYIASSSFSDSSIGKKIGHAESAIDVINNQIGSIVDIDGDIYQLTFESSYTSTNSTHTGIVRKNGENVTSSTYWNRFKWYLLKSTGKQQITSGISDNVLTMPIADYRYGMALILEWVDANNNVLARYSITIVDNAQITDVATQAGDAITIANDTQQYFWHTETGTDTGAHITQVPKDTFLQNPSGSNLLARTDGIAFRQGLNELGVLTSGGAYYNALVNGQYRVIAQYTPTSIQLGLSDAGYDNLYINPSGNNAGMYFRNGSINIAKYTTSGMYLYNGSGYPTMSVTGDGLVVYDGTNYQRNLLNVDANGMTLRGVFDDTLSKSGEFNDDGLIIYGYTNGTARGEIANISSMNGNSPTGTSKAPYYTFGVRKSGESVGNYSFAIGNNITASGYVSYAEGSGTVSSGSYSHVEGDRCKATVYCAHAEGLSSTASGQESHAEGGVTTASGDASHAEGYDTTASGTNAHAEGLGSTATGNRSHAEGYTCIASGSNSHAEGNITEASGNNAHAEGYFTYAIGEATHTQNVGTVATASGQTVIGKYNKATVTGSGTTSNPYVYTNVGDYAFIIGNGNNNATASRSNCFTVGFDGHVIANATGYTSARIQLTLNGTSKVWMGIGSGGSNHGVYSDVIDKWLIYSTGDGVHTGTTTYTHGGCRPASDNSYALGSSDYHWTKVYAKNGTIDTSDKKDKDILGAIDFAEDLILNIKPIQYMWKDGDHRRTRMGFIAQDVAKVCGDMNLNLSLYSASYKGVKDDNKPYYGENVDDNLLAWGITYKELIAPMIQVIQNQHKEIESLKVEMQNLKGRKVA